ncbi:MAG: hypothetical protein EXS16_19155 [Gemmataceae bacterium]|nr:hypothetical protein [Gemmataceae bacterium]
MQVHSKQLGAWYRTLDVLIRATDKIELALYHHLRDLFRLKPDLVLFDITSAYFKGAGPEDFAKRGYSRDGKSYTVQALSYLSVCDDGQMENRLALRVDPEGAGRL